MIIAADIGGTKTSVALFEPPKKASDAERTPQPLEERRYSSADYPNLTQILSEFLEACSIEGGRVRRVCAGIAGPVVRGRVQTPNLPWVVDAEEMRVALGVGAVHLINDLEATAERAATLTGADVSVLNEGKPPTEHLTNGAVIAAGTGLGMAILHPIDGAWWPVASEGGHADFAPRNEVEMDLLRFLLEKHPRVSVERVVAGPGLATLYEFFARRLGSANAEVCAELAAAGPEAAPRIVSEAALSHRCPAADAALDLFVEQYGAAAGNLGLVAIATGGLFVGGGIAPKILERMKAGGFMKAFLDKGRLSPLLEATPVKVILDSQAALMGAARRALRLELGLVRES